MTNSLAFPGARASQTLKRLSDRSARWWWSLGYLLIGITPMLPLTTAWGANELTFAVARTPLSLPIYVAEIEGFFAKEGASVRIVDCAFGKLCLEQVIEGKASLCTVADLPIVFASFATNRFAVVATLATNRNDAKIVSRKGNHFRSAADLRGKKVGVVLGTSSHYFLDSAALLAGVDPSSITMVNMRTEEMTTRLKTGEVDALSVFEPFAFEAARALGDDAAVLSTKRVYALTWNVVAAKESLEPDDRAMERLLRALDRAVRLIHSDPDRAKGVLKARLGLDDAAIAWVWPDLVFGLALEPSLIKTMEAEARWALRNGNVSGKEPNYLRYIHEAPLGRAKPGSVDIVR
jgi:ABC-type nitrate/sulfonate/bicarbonate transport system substrate-binding protein